MSVNFRDNGVTNQMVATWGGEAGHLLPPGFLEEIKIEERKEQYCAIFAQSKNFGDKETAVASARL
jgi:hypothetical protein